MTESTARSLLLSDLAEEVVRTAAPQESALRPRADAPLSREVPARAGAVRAAVLAVGPALGVSTRPCRLIADAAYAVLLRHRSGAGS
ncbi:hypothetical protein AB0B27_24730 [Micromonospora rifamycinica]|uniref:hypothetical protein n=1 Tax=Micromonospora rifamycinica TaxID=291594 RepID=UPI0033F5CE87